MKNNIANILKITLLTLLFVGTITYITAPKQPMRTDGTIPKKLSLESIPQQIELVGQKNTVSKSTLFKSGQKTILAVGNHDSIAVIKHFKKYFKVNADYIMVANISSAPWFIKKWAIPSKLEELNRDTGVPMIYDYDGTMARVLNIKENDATKYAVYLMDENGNIKEIYKGSVQEGALDKELSEAEIKTTLSALFNKIKDII